MIKEKAAEAYKEGKITISEAAQQASLTIWEMEEYLVDKGYKSDYSIDDLEKEILLMSKKRGQLVWDNLIPWIIGIAVLVLMFVLYFILSGKGQSAITFLKNLFRF